MQSVLALIKGFAIQLLSGFATSMFTAIVGTRAIVNLLYGGKRIETVYLSGARLWHRIILLNN